MTVVTQVKATGVLLVLHLCYTRGIPVLKDKDWIRAESGSFSLPYTSVGI